MNDNSSGDHSENSGCKYIFFLIIWNALNVHLKSMHILLVLTFFPLCALSEYGPWPPNFILFSDLVIINLFLSAEKKYKVYIANSDQPSLIDFIDSYLC